MNETQMYQDNIDYGRIDSEHVADNVGDNSTAYSESGETYTEDEKEKRPTSFWIISLKILSSLMFIGVLVFGLIRSIGIFLNGNELAGLLVFLAVSISSFMGLALVMVFLNLAEDSMISRYTLEMIRESNKQR